LFSIGRSFFRVPSNHVEPQRTPEHALQRGAVPLCGPEFQLDIALGPETYQIILTA